MRIPYSPLKFVGLWVKQTCYLGTKDIRIVDRPREQKVESAVQDGT